ncbi:Lipoyltransferase and lipoate-protein ligase [Coprinellus micaceus]|uniref:Putative lipoate-protein ligase A n=1 Tax=Coprinellus micaceus TaxID=71717 RepID=A0A4Y7TDM2_COPMI|nr:Lipoyltransferase and lipoate-protein ligase [Coprinellus micaceus]
MLASDTCSLGLSTRHHYSTNAPSASASLPRDWGKHSIFVSLSDDPYFNLSVEDLLFRRHDAQRPVLLIYRDSPCVVIGRNQNPWKEVNFSELERLGIPFIRRRSGGGTVYHDLGNTNFSIHLPRATFDRHATGGTVLRAVRSLGIDARLNDRNDICIGPEKMRSAYKIVNNRAYHHGTMLISTRLDTLGDLLRVKGKDRMVTKGVASVRSPVCNLQQFNENVSHQAFTNAVVAQFKRDYTIDEEPVLISDTEEELRDHAEIRRGMDELPQWEWAFGQTPEFTYQVQQAFSWGQVSLDIRSKHGIVLECSAQLSDSLDETGDISELVMDLSRSIVGQRYGSLKLDAGPERRAFADKASEPELGTVVLDLRAWLSEIA